MSKARKTTKAPEQSGASAIPTPATPTPEINQDLGSGDTSTEIPSVDPIGSMPESLDGKVVVIPYLASAAKGGELLLAIRSWCQHYPDLARIVIVGDLPPQLEGRVFHIPHRPESDNPQIDVACKMAAAIASDLVPDLFIWSNDDIFLLSQLEFEDIAVKKVQDLSLKKRAEANSVYGKNTQNTINALQKIGISRPLNYDGHIPVVFQKAALARVLEDFECTKEGHLVSSLYFNSLWPKARPILFTNDAEGTVVASVFKANPNKEILEQVLKTKQYINCNDAGWPSVEPYLLKLFPKKSKFEN